MIKLPKPQAVLFDWDNTLVDTWPTIHQALNMTLRHMQHPEWSLDQVRANVKQSMRDAFPAMFGDRWTDAADHYQQSYRALHLGHLAPLPGAEETLRALTAQALFLGIVSNKKGDTLRLELAHLGWEHYFDAVVGAGDAARDKPHGDPALLALENYGGVRERSVWFIGDTSVDLGCAAAIGATAVLYGDHEVRHAMHDGHAFHVHARNHRALQQLLAGSD